MRISPTVPKEEDLRFSEIDPLAGMSAEIIQNSDDSMTICPIKFGKQSEIICKNKRWKIWSLLLLMEI